MSIKSTYIIPETGLAIPDGYVKIMYFKGAYKQEDKYNVLISTCLYASKLAKEQGLKPIDENREIELYIDATEFESTPLMELLYNKLKETYTKSIDC